jgi:hypothetical protein
MPGFLDAWTGCKKNKTVKINVITYTPIYVYAYIRVYDIASSGAVSSDVGSSDVGSCDVGSSGAVSSDVGSSDVASSAV